MDIGPKFFGYYIRNQEKIIKKLQFYQTLKVKFLQGSQRLINNFAIVSDNTPMIVKKEKKNFFRRILSLNVMG